jgi:hypothetical protein
MMTIPVTIEGKTLTVSVKKTGMATWHKGTFHVLSFGNEDGSMCYADLQEPVTEEEVTRFLAWLLRPDPKRYKSAAIMLNGLHSLKAWQDRLRAKLGLTPSSDTPKPVIVAVADRKADSAPKRKAPPKQEPVRVRSLNLF